MRHHILWHCCEVGKRGSWTSLDIMYHMLAIPGKSPASTKHSHLLTKCESFEVAIPQLIYSLHFDFNAISSCILAWNRLGEAWHRQ